MFISVFIPWTNTKGALCGAIAAVVTVGTIAVGSLFNLPAVSQKLPTFTDKCTNETVLHNEIPNDVTTSVFHVSFLYFRVISVSITVIVGVIVSLCTKPQDPTKLNPRYFSPLISSKVFPEKWRMFMRFGVPDTREENDNKCSNDEQKNTMLKNTTL